MSKHSLDPELSGFIHNLRAALPYMEEFDQQTFVIYLSGELIEVQNSRVIEDLALLQQVGIRIVLVHGVELQIRDLYASQRIDYHIEDEIFVAEEKNIPLFSLFCQLEAAVKVQELCSSNASFYRTFLIS